MRLNPQKLTFTDGLYVMAMGTATILHLGWVVSLWNYSGVTRCVALAPFWGLCGTGQSIAWAFILITALAVIAKLPGVRGWWTFGLMLPQQISLMISGYSAWECIRNSAYADGVPRDPHFIFNDQWGGLVPMLIHSIYMVCIFYQCVLREDQR